MDLASDAGFEGAGLRCGRRECFAYPRATTRADGSSATDDATGVPTWWAPGRC